MAGEERFQRVLTNFGRLQDDRKETRINTQPIAQPREESRRVIACSSSPLIIPVPPISHSRAHPAHTAVLSLPGEEVQQRAEWLSDQTEADPEDAISNSLSKWILHILQRCSESNQRQLEKHAHSGDA